MEKFHPRVIREKITMEKMITLYCRREHKSTPGSLCQDCSDLLQYAHERLNRCPFQEKKSTCAKCTIHCYKPKMRLKIRRVMAASGPQMLIHHPVLTIRHFLDGVKPAPILRKKLDDSPS